MKYAFDNFEFKGMKDKSCSQEIDSLLLCKNNFLDTDDVVKSCLMSFVEYLEKTMVKESLLIKIQNKAV